MWHSNGYRVMKGEKRVGQTILFNSSYYCALAEHIFSYYCTCVERTCENKIWTLEYNV